jgi:hypothetical protein
VRWKSQVSGAISWVQCYQHPFLKEGYCMSFNPHWQSISHNNIRKNWLTEILSLLSTRHGNISISFEVKLPSACSFIVDGLAARRRQLNLKTYWTIQCSRMLKYNITETFLTQLLPSPCPPAAPCICVKLTQTLRVWSHKQDTFLYRTSPYYISAICVYSLLVSPYLLTWMIEHQVHWMPSPTY